MYIYLLINFYAVFVTNQVCNVAEWRQLTNLLVIKLHKMFPIYFLIIQFCLVMYQQYLQYVIEHKNTWSVSCKFSMCKYNITISMNRKAKLLAQAKLKLYVIMLTTKDIPDIL